MREKELQYLAAAMAHEVRNPLNSMAIHVNMLEGRLSREGSGPEVLRSLGVLAQEVERIDEILEQYLSFAGPSEGERVAVTLGHLLEKVLAALGERAERAKVTLTLKGGGESQRWSLDAEALIEALAAIGQRAVAGSPPGATVAFFVTIDGKTEQAEIRVTDSAPALAAGELGHLFQIGKGDAAGETEVGLAVAKQIIRVHGGSVTAQAAPGGGNQIVVRLPLDSE